MSKKYIFLIILFLSVIYNLVALSPGESYFSIEKWYQNNELGGEVRIQLTINKICNNKIEISIEKDMTPFSQILNFTVEAKYEKGKYVFHCFDNWGNKIFGYFSFESTENEKIAIFFDVEEYSDFGKNVARLYGETSILTKGAIIF